MRPFARLPWLTGFLLCCSCQGLPDRGVVTVPSGGGTPPIATSARRSDAACERFLVLGDMGTGGKGQKEIASVMALRAEKDGLDFVLTVGDNFYPDGVASVDDRQWNEKFEDMYATASLQVPFYASLGNHDYHTNPRAEIEYSKRGGRWRMPDFYYTFTRKLSDGTLVQFFAIDSDPLVKSLACHEKQLAWLDDELRKSTARWKIVFGHHPLYGHNPKRGHNRDLIAKLEPIFVKHQIDVYFAGHDHALEMIKPVKGVHYVISGGGGGTDNPYAVNSTEESYYAATGGGFAFCRISRDELVIEFVRPTGITEFSHTLTK